MKYCVLTVIDTETVVNRYVYTLNKKEIFGQLNPLEKCFKIWYVYGKRKPT